MAIQPIIFDRRILGAAAIGVCVSSPLYYWIGLVFGPRVPLLSIYCWTAIFVASLLVGYELFFRVQAKTTDWQACIVSTSIDHRIPFLVGWVWIYSVLYYVLLGLPLAFLSRFEQCLICIGGGFAILLLSSTVYLIWPTRCPPEWRRYEVNGLSARLLEFIQRMDKGRNCCPSLHCALATYTASLLPFQLLMFSIPALICLSCLFVKQHSIIDVPPSLVLGFFMGAVINKLI